MSQDEETDLKREIRSMRNESVAWRKDNDDAMKTFRDMVIEEVAAYRQIVSKVNDRLVNIEATTKSHSIDIAYVNKLKEKAGWGWETMKVIATISGYVLGISWIVGVGYQYMKDLFCELFNKN